MKVRSSFLPVWLAAFLVVLALSHPAVAAEKGELVKDQENAARAACLMGDYQRGAEILVKLFIQTRDPTYLYNQGRCYQQNHRWEEALDRFREYLRKAPKLADSAKAEVQQHIAECEANQSKPAVIPPLPPEPASASRRSDALRESSQSKAIAEERVVPAANAFSDKSSAGTSADGVDLTQAAPAPSDASSETSILTRWWFWTAVGAVVAGGVTAGLLLSRSTSSKPFSCPECESTLGVNAP
jgi:tetratricopeptide (TPR) repeat protein